MAERRRPPWWMDAVLVCCASYILSVWYVHVTGPEPSGLEIAPEAAGLVVSGIQPGAAADRAGLEKGDVLESVNGRTRRAAYFDLVHFAAAGRRYELGVDRHGERRAVTLVLGRKSASYWATPEGLAHLADVLVAALCTALAWLVALRRPDDATARLAALVLAIWPVATTHFLRGAPDGWPALVAGLPFPLGLPPLLAVLAASAPFPLLVLMLFASFPRRLVRGRWVWLPLWMCGAVAGAAIVAALYNLFVQPAVLVRVPSWLLGPVLRIGDLVNVAIPVVLIWNYRGLTDRNERRRMRVLVAGAAVSFAVGGGELLLRNVPSAAVGRLLVAYWSSPFLLVGVALAALGPLAIAYAVLRHRIFDIRVIVRQGLQYAVARGLLLALAPLFGLALVADLAFHSDQTMAEAFAARGWLYAVLAVAAFAAHRKSGTWLAALDRRFFRERYDAQRILRSVLTNVHQTSDLPSAALHAVSQIEAGLHPEFAAVLVRHPGDAAFAVAASSGTLPLAPEIAADGKLVGLLRILGKPVELSQSETGWLRRQLPPEEAKSLTRARVEWVFPVALGAERTETLLALGPRRSEEPYTREDQELVEGVAAGLGLLAERTSLAPREPAGTAETEVPRIARRYLIRRELGRGGMGAVYEARDTELERSVAVKLMRPELLDSAEAVARFKREARAAAGLTHPNVVTVYDFGVGDDGRAYLVMELLAGCTLREALQHDGRFPPERAVHVLRGVCAAVQAAHEQQLLHRDLKPENVFLARAGGVETPKVLDFGVAKPLVTTGTSLVTDTATGHLVGTLAYMSPEQLLGGPPAPSWDLWALVLIAYEMLTAAHPFAGAGGPAHAAVLSGSPTSASVHLGPDGRCWDGFFARALGPYPRERPATAHELVESFARVAAGVPAPR